MLTITETRKKMAYVKAQRRMEGLSERQIITIADSLERSTDERERLQSIAIRAILMGDTEKSFKKACKMYAKNTEHIRYA